MSSHINPYEFNALKEEVEALREMLRANPLRHASVDRGRLRMEDGSELRVEGLIAVIGRLNVLGEWRFSGNGAITGDVVAEGKWTQNGDFELNGDGDISGDVDLTGDLGVLGNGRVKVGTRMTLTPARDGGSIDFENGAFLSSNASSIGLTKGSNTVRLGDDLVGLLAGSRSYTVRSGYHEMQGIEPATQELMQYLQWLARDTRNGRLYVVPPGMGGPSGGPFEWPFDESTVTSEYGMRDHPDGQGVRLHAGRDFAPPAGTPIPSMSRGTVTTSTYGDGWGNYVVVDHGYRNGQHLQTLYAHMASPGVAVGTVVDKGTILGNVGNTGDSFGAHLHLETWINGTAVDPRDFMAQYGLAA